MSMFVVNYFLSFALLYQTQVLFFFKEEIPHDVLELEWVAIMLSSTVSYTRLHKISEREKKLFCGNFLL